MSYKDPFKADNILDTIMTDLQNRMEYLVSLGITLFELRDKLKEEFPQLSEW